MWPVTCMCHLQGILVFRSADTFREFKGTFCYLVMPPLALAVLAFSDGSQFACTAEAHSTWLMRCGGYPHLHPCRRCDFDWM